jgi:serine kinase of HPr protein (carbohydrate metabolism regulator)
VTATSTSIHGNLIVIQNTGILITGNPGSGKSDLSLKLIRRGHQFVADDLVQITLNDSLNTLIGHQVKTPEFPMHLRDEGFIDVGKTYGLQSVRNQAAIHLVVHLTNTPMEPTWQQLLDIPVKKYSLNNRSQRPLALLIEDIVAKEQINLGESFSVKK